jgi:hypothetical protein
MHTIIIYIQGRYKVWQQLNLENGFSEILEIW